MTAQLDRRYTARAAGLAGRTFSGYAIRYGEPTAIGDPKSFGFFEQVDAGAFKRALRSSGLDVVALWNHNADELLGRTSAGTLRLDNRKDGLFDEIDLPETQRGRDITELTARGDIRGQSFGFVVRDDKWAAMPGGHTQMRTIMDADLYDVSPVTSPAYPTTSAAVRSLARRALRAGADRREARAVGQGVEALIAKVRAADACVDAAIEALASGNRAQAADLMNAAQAMIAQATTAAAGIDAAALVALGVANIPALVAAADSAITAAAGAVSGPGDEVDVNLFVMATAATDVLLEAMHVADPDEDKGAEPVADEPANGDDLASQEADAGAAAAATGGGTSAITGEDGLPPVAMDAAPGDEAGRSGAGAQATGTTVDISTYTLRARRAWQISTNED